MPRPAAKPSPAAAAVDAKAEAKPKGTVPKPAKAKPAAPKADAKKAKKADKKPVAKAEPRPPSRLPFAAQLLSPADQATGKRAMQEAAAGRFDKARDLAAQAQEPLIGRLVHWLWLQTPNSGAPFEAIASFIDSAPDWPARDAILRRAEEALTDAIPDSRVVDWFANRQPETGLGWVRLAEAFERTGRTAEALEAARKGWMDANLSMRDEAEVWRDFGPRFTAAENSARLDRLLWDEQYEAARRMLPRVTPEIRALGEARLALALRAANAERVAEALPDHLKQDGGLAYDRMRWNRRQGKDDIVEALLNSAPEDLGRAEKWWVERHFRARKAMAEGRITEAYRLAAGHGIKGGVAQVEAEWLAGWIALRLLQEPKTALPHFTALQANVRTPVSLARAGYWLGRTQAALGDQQQARIHFVEAARYATTYYGQLAAYALNPREKLILPDDPEPSAEALRRFEQREVVRAARILMELDQEQRLRPFILRLAHTAESLDEHQLTARLARTLHRVDLAVAAAKRSARYGGITLVREAFPLVEPMAQTQVPETALVLAVARQESEFNQYAISPAGARGLMQLMPATAKGVAKELKATYQQAKLTDDPQYNVRFGSHYLQGLLQNWDGNYVLSLAGYNAGEARVRKWIKDWGDPRHGTIDPIDWVELIPFSETRNYVQRVIEGVQVYRALLGGQTVPIDRMMADLRGLPRRACATESC